MGKLDKFLESMKRELKCPYREPTQVPLAEEVKACRI
jgi:hypothetical protein